MKLPFSRAKIGAFILGILGIAKIVKGVHDGDGAIIQTGATEVGGALAVWGIRDKQDKTENKIDAATGTTPEER